MDRTCSSSSSRNGRRKVLKKQPLEKYTYSNCLPFDIIETILSRLPVKSLLRFKSVSKQWYAMISDTRFARIHLRQSKNSNSTLFLCIPKDGSSTFSRVRLTNQSFQVEEVEFPLKKYRGARVLGSCDGVFVLRSSFDKRCVLWNPSSRAYTEFMCPYPIGKTLETSGLCYDASNDDYKFIWFIDYFYGYAVFSCKNNSWIEKDSSDPLSITGPGILADGALHWVVECFDDNRARTTTMHSYPRSPHKHYRKHALFNYEIQCFDPRDDEFKTLPHPESLDIKSVFGLTDLRGKLCLYRNSFVYNMMEIWMMKEHGDCSSWTKLLNIEDVPVWSGIGNVTPLCLTNEGNIVLNMDGSKFVVYDTKKNKFGENHVEFEHDSDCIEYKVWRARVCLGSLFLPSIINRPIKRKRYVKVPL